MSGTSGLQPGPGPPTGGFKLQAKEGRRVNGEACPWGPTRLPAGLCSPPTGPGTRAPSVMGVGGQGSSGEGAQVTGRPCPGPCSPPPPGQASPTCKAVPATSAGGRSRAGDIGGQGLGEQEPRPQPTGPPLPSPLLTPPPRPQGPSGSQTSLLPDPSHLEAAAPSLQGVTAHLVQRGGGPLTTLALAIWGLSDQPESPSHPTAPTCPASLGALLSWLRAGSGHRAGIRLGLSLPSCMLGSQSCPPVPLCSEPIPWARGQPRWAQEPGHCLLAPGSVKVPVGVWGQSGPGFRLGENSEPRPTLSENSYSSVTGGRSHSQEKGARATSDGGEGRAWSLG